MTPMFAGNGIFMLLVAVAAFLVLSTLMQRPLKKQAAEQARMRSEVGEGTRVLLASGLFGTITHTGAEQMIVEIAPGVEVTCLKDSIAKVVTVDDEEFVYDDDTTTGDVTTDDVTTRDVTTDDEVTGDAGAMGSAAPGTAEGLGVPAPGTTTHN